MTAEKWYNPKCSFHRAFAVVAVNALFKRHAVSFQWHFWRRMQLADVVVLGEEAIDWFANKVDVQRVRAVVQCEIHEKQMSVKDPRSAAGVVFIEFIH